MRKIYGLLGLVGIASVGCQPVDSSDVATDGIYANMSVSASGDGNTTAVTTLRVGGALSNTYLDLTENDALIAYAAPGYTLSDTMDKQNVLGAISYHATFPIDAADTPFKVSFLRTHSPEQECNGVSAPNSVVTLPAGFVLNGPPAAPLSRANDPVTFTWTPSGTTDVMTWSAIGTCIISTFNNAIAGDPGTYTIGAGNIMSSTTNGTCAVTIEVERGRTGTLDAAFIAGEGGRIHARQHRSDQFNSAP